MAETSAFEAWRPSAHVRRAHADGALLALAIVLFLCWRFSPGGDDQTRGALILAVTAMAAAGVAAATGRRRAGSIRLAWFAIAAGCAVWAAGVLSITSTILHTSLSGRYVALHLGWSGLASALAAGTVLLSVPSPDGEARRKLALDLMPTVIALLVVVWLAVFGPSAIDVETAWRLRAAALVHGAGALVLVVAALAGALRRARPTDAGPVRLLALGAVALAVADLTWLQPWLGGRVDASLPAQVGFLLGFVAIALGGFRARVAPSLVESIDAAAPSPDTGPWLQQVPHLSLLTLLLLAAGQRLAGDLQPHGAETAVVGSIAVVVFVMMRQGLALRQASRLHGEIGHLTEQIDGLIQQVGRDPLTGLLNRRAVLGRIEQELVHGRACGHPLTVVLIDVDNFKSVNDTLGHQAGDRVLLAVGSILTAVCRGTDVAARYAGDEFLLVLPGLDEADAGHVCERIVLDVRRLADELDLGGVRVTLSVGAAVSHRCRLGAAQVIAIADAAMYDAKEGGKDRVVTVDADTLLAPGTQTRDGDDLPTPVTYLPSTGSRAVTERRGRRLVGRAS
jgi:diguanylate cyclase